MVYNFDGVNKLIILQDDVGIQDGGVISFNAQDLYSRWKEWALNNLEFPPAMRSIGGDQLTLDEYIAPYIEVLVDNGWRIKPFSIDGNYTLYVEGNLFGTNGVIPFIGADYGTVNVVLKVTGNAIALQTSNVSEDLTAPTWINSVGITDCYQNNDCINISWGSAKDSSGDVKYRVFISDSVSDLFSPENILGDFDGNFLSIYTESDGVTKLRDNVIYYISVRAVDKYGNETINTNYAEITFKDPDNIVQQIWDFIVDPDNSISAKQLLLTISNNIKLIKDIESGNWKIDNNQMIFYDENGVEIMRFALFDKNGIPSETEVYYRERV